MRPGDAARAQGLKDRLCSFSDSRFKLPGIAGTAEMEAFVEQLIDSIRRVEYVQMIAVRSCSPRRANPAEEIFDPIRAAVLYKNSGQFDEACWLVFLAVHFGWHPVTRWRLVRDVYGAMGQTRSWTWQQISGNTESFRDWLHENIPRMHGQDIPRRFGNHRKYLSLDAWSGNQTGAAIASYVQWIEQYGDHAQLFSAAASATSGGSTACFDWLYRSMTHVASFGRIAKFDYLCMLRKLGLADISAGRLYLSGATGPLSGARRLLHDSVGARKTPQQLDTIGTELAQYLEIDMQVMEDALCNWNKAPSVIKHYRI